MTPPELEPVPDRPARRMARMLVLGAIAVAAVAGTIAFGDRLSFELLRDNRETLLAIRDAHYLLTALAFMGVYVGIVLFAIPGALVASLTGGFLFGLFPGVAFNVISATVGSILIFLAVRWGIGARLAARMEVSEGRMQRLRKAVDENAFSALLTLRLIPVIPFFATNIAAALVGMRLAPFAAATAVGVIPGGFVYTWVGAGLGEVFERGDTPNLGLVFEWPVLGPLLALAALSALPTLLRLRRLRNAPHD
ncbi:MAG: TVP38/TMEM64 family protein [Alkalilacustris sp.]